MDGELYRDKNIVCVLLFPTTKHQVVGQSTECFLRPELILHFIDRHFRITEHLCQEYFHDYSSQPLSHSTRHLEIYVQWLPVQVDYPLWIHLCQSINCSINYFFFLNDYKLDN